MNKVDELAKVILNYMYIDMKLEKADLIIGFGASDIRIADEAVRLFKQGFAPKIIFTGGHGRITKGLHSISEAKRFSERAVELGVDEQSIILEEEASNTGENITKSVEVIKKNQLKHKKIIIVTKPYMERRVYLTIMKQWPLNKTEIIVTAPKLPYEQQFNEEIPRDLFINIMVGDVQRIKLYPEKGFMEKEAVPEEVWSAYEELVSLGYDKQLIKD